MWSLIIRHPGLDTRSVPLTAGKMTIGRQLDNDVVLSDTSVSRLHAEIQYRPDDNWVAIHDRQSANGTFVNLQRLKQGQVHHLRLNDLIQIGATEIKLVRTDRQPAPAPAPVVTVQEPAEERPGNYQQLLFEVARQLNVVQDTESALLAVSELLRNALGADRCEVLLASQFDQLRQRGLSVTIASKALEARAPIAVPEHDYDRGIPISDTAARASIFTALCVPVLSGDNIIALIYLYKSNPQAPRFEPEQLQIAEAVSHMMALALERMTLSQRIYDEQRLRQLLECQLTPSNADFLLHNQLKTGRLPGIGVEYATVMVVDIADSTGWAERLGAKGFGEMLKKYYQEVTDVILDRNGLLHKYLGDGVMAVFGLNESNQNAQVDAVDAGLAVLSKIENSYHFADRRLRVGVGINSGPVMAGYVNTRQRVEHAVLGDTVNVAFGLQTLARPNRLLIGQETWRDVKQLYKTNDMGRTNIKGRTESIRVYEVLRENQMTAPLAREASMPAVAVGLNGGY